MKKVARRNILVAGGAFLAGGSIGYLARQRGVTDVAGRQDTVGSAGGSSANIEIKDRAHIDRPYIHIEGDSRSATYSSVEDNTRTFQHSFITQSLMRYGHCFEVTGRTAEYGSTIEEMAARITTQNFAVNTSPNMNRYISLFCGVNSIAQKANGADSASRLIETAEQLRKRNVTPILFLDPGAENFSGSKIIELEIFNRTISNYCFSMRAEPNFRPLLVDVPRSVLSSDPRQDSKIKFREGCSYDGVHYTVLGAARVAEVFYLDALTNMPGAHTLSPRGVQLLTQDVSRRTEYKTAEISGVGTENTKVTCDPGFDSVRLGVIDASTIVEYTLKTNEKQQNIALERIGIPEGVKKGRYRLVVPVTIAPGSGGLLAVQARIEIEKTNGEKLLNYEGHYSLGKGLLGASTGQNLQLATPTLNCEEDAKVLRPHILITVSDDGPSRSGQVIVGPFELWLDTET